MINNGDPLVTIAIPTKNSSSTIRESIQSALAQTYKNIEILVADDESQDDTAEKVLTFQDSRVRLLQNNPPLGLVGTRNQLLEEAKGSYLAWQDSDDVSSPNRIRLQLQSMHQNPDIKVCGGWFTKIAAEIGNYATSTSILAPYVENCKLPNHLDYIKVGQLFGNVQPMSVLMMKVFTSDGKRVQLNAEFETAEDCHLVSTSIAVGQFGYTNASLVKEVKSLEGINATQGERQHQLIRQIMQDLALKLGFSKRAYDAAIAQFLSSAVKESIDSNLLLRLNQWCQNLLKENQDKQIVLDSTLRWWMILLWGRLLSKNEIKISKINWFTLNLFVLQPRWMAALLKVALWKLKLKFS